MNLKFISVILCELLLLNEQGMPTKVNPLEDLQAPVPSYENYTYLGWAANHYWWLAKNKYEKDTASVECQQLYHRYRQLLPDGSKSNLSWNFARPKYEEIAVVEYLLEERNIDYAWVSGWEMYDEMGDIIEKFGDDTTVDECKLKCVAAKKSKPPEEVRKPCCDKYLYFCLAAIK